MVFKKYAPTSELKHIIAYHWTLETTSEDNHDTYRFVPDGFVDWIFHLGTPWQCSFPDQQEHSVTGQFHVFGQIKKYVDLNVSNGQVNLFGVKFYPWVAKTIWKTDMYYLTNACNNIDDLELPRIHELQEKVILSDSTASRIHHIETYLKTHSDCHISDSLKPVLDRVFSKGQFNLSDIHFGLRRLEQRFKNEIGISPKLFSKTLRINKAIEQLTEQPQESLTKIGLNVNFYDQSHFIKDFKQFTGYSPSQFLKYINPNGDILNLQAH